MLPAISQVCTLHAPFEKDIDEFAAGHCGAVEIWWGKLEAFLKDHSIDDVRRLLAEHEMPAPVASYQGGLLASQGEARREHWTLFAHRLELCQSLGIGTMVVAADVEGPLGEQDFDRLRASLRQAAEHAGAAGVRIALEFQSRSAFPNNLQSAAMLVADCGSPQLGICLDMFHFYTGPSKHEDFGLLTPENLFHVQLCDLAGNLREFATDADRVLPGDGDFQLAPVVARLRDIGYTGAVSVELMNPRIWQIPPRQVGEVAMTALRRVLGLASMG
ncbi:MAG TPA: sugar phosphate isomerase/epimerase family protein [Pirellulales bacterium]